jgi:hypothetical protein
MERGKRAPIALFADLASKPFAVGYAMAPSVNYAKTSSPLPSRSPSLSAGPLTAAVLAGAVGVAGFATLVAGSAGPPGW